jgi:hypothetical protein
MAQCLEFDQIITKAGRVPPVVGPHTKMILYTVPGGHVAKIDTAENLGSGLMYAVTSATGIPSGFIANTSASAGEALPSRHRNLSKSWMGPGDSLYVYDLYDPDNTNSTSHPDGFYVVIIEYDVISGC